MLKELLGKKETSNLKQPCTYIYYYIKTSKTSTVLLEDCLYAGVSLHSLFEFNFFFFFPQRPSFGLDAYCLSSVCAGHYPLW